MDSHFKRISRIYILRIAFKVLKTQKADIIPLMFIAVLLMVHFTKINSLVLKAPIRNLFTIVGSLHFKSEKRVLLGKKGIVV